MTTTEHLAIYAYEVEKLGRTFKTLNTKRLRDQAANAARDYSRRVTNVSTFAVGHAAIDLAHAATRAWHLARQAEAEKAVR